MQLKSTTLALFSFFILIANSVHAVPIGQTEVPLNGLRSDVRTMETNLGNLVADAFLWQAHQSGQNPNIAIQNSGAIRNDSIDFPSATTATPVTIDSTWPSSVLPFSEEIGTIGGITISTFQTALENAVSRSSPSDSGSGQGRFLQISGFSFSWDVLAPAGNRIIDAVLNDGTALINDGNIVSNALLNVTMNAFVAAGGDGFDWSGGSLVGTGVNDNAALTNFVTTAKGGLISESDYPAGGGGRIQRNVQLIPVPATLALFGIGIASLGWSRRKAVL